MAMVSFKEGKNEKEAADETRVLVKQNGTWKIAGLNVIFTSAYNLQYALNTLRSFTGTWKLDTSSLKTEQTAKVSNQSVTTDIRETPNGIEMVTHRSFTSNGQPYSMVETEQFIPDYGNNEINYIDINKSSSGASSIDIGKAEMNSNGNLTITIMDKDKPAIKRGEAEAILQKDGTLQIKNKWYDTDGKQLGANSFVLRRL